jgi:hypothetical protein
MDNRTKTARNGGDTGQLEPTWSAGSNGHVGTLELNANGVQLGLEIYRAPGGQLLWLWRDGKTRRVCYRAAPAEGGN